MLNTAKLELACERESMASLKASHASELQALQQQLQQARSVKPAARQSSAAVSVDVDGLTQMVVQSIQEVHDRVWASKVTTLKLRTRLQVSGGSSIKSKALKAFEGYEDRFSEALLPAIALIREWQPAEDELDALDEAYFRLSCCMHECSRRAALTNK